MAGTAEPAGLSGVHETTKTKMKPERILVPLDVASCPVEVFRAVNGFAERPGVTILLLHVVNLNIVAPENRVYDELGRDADWHLKRLAGKCLNPGASILTRVRFGKPAEEIVVAAKEEDADLIVLPMHRGSFCKRMFTFLAPQIIQHVIQEAPCGVCLVEAKTRFNCEKLWGRPFIEIAATPEYSDRPAGAKGSWVLPGRRSPATTWPSGFARRNA
jgi:nucleotide-binding universal stress UspA family protein